MDSPSSYKIVIVDLRTCHGFVGRRVGYKISFLGITIYNLPRFEKGTRSNSNLPRFETAESVSCDAA